MEITERDQKLLADIQEYGLLPTKIIAARHFGKVALTTVLRRLRQLEQASYIQRVPGLKNGGHAWGLSRTAGQELNGEPFKWNFPESIVEHDVTLTEVRLKLEEAQIALAWMPEHCIRSRAANHSSRNATISDGIMGISTSYGYQVAVAVELELTAKNQARYRKIHEEYSRKRELWAYLYVVRNPTIAKQIVKAIRNPFLSSGPFFMWCLLGDVLCDPINAKVTAQEGFGTLGKIMTPHPAHAARNRATPLLTP